MTDPIRYMQQTLGALYPKGELQSMIHLIMERVCGLQPYQLLLGKGKEISDAEKQHIREIVDRLLKEEPIQYILGEADFCGLLFEVNPSVLIPRPETAELVRLIQAAHPVASAPNPLRLLDIGTGSGCIAISLAHHFGTQAHVSAMDLSEEALAVARTNAQRHQVPIDFLHADILQLSQTPQCSQATWDVIVSNPPYILEREKPSMEKNVLAYEPALALFVPDHDPLRFYRAIARWGRHHLSAQGELYFEINALFGPETVAMLESEGYRQVTLIRDLYDKERFIHAYK